MKKLTKEEQLVKEYLDLINILLIELIFNESKPYSEIKKEIYSLYEPLNSALTNLISLYKGTDKEAELIKFKDTFSGAFFINLEELNLKQLRNRILSDYKKLFTSYSKYYEAIERLEDNYIDEEYALVVMQLKNSLNKLNNVYFYYICEFENIPNIFNYPNNLNKETINLFKKIPKIIINEENEYDKYLKWLRNLSDALKIGSKVVDFYFIINIIESYYSAYAKSYLIVSLISALSVETIYRVVNYRLRRKVSVHITNDLTKNKVLY